MGTMATVDDATPFAGDLNIGATRAERRALGKRAREQAPLASHAETHIATSMRDVIGILKKSSEGRIEELLPIRYGRMLTSPFTFYRGSAALMAFDLARTPNSGSIVQACGDCHIQNLGVFATPERKLVIDINDFDETLPAPWEWDVKRLAASLVLAAMANGMKIDTGRDAAQRMARGYREHMAELAEMTHLEVWYSHVEMKEILELVKGESRELRKNLLEEAARKSSPEVLTQKLLTRSKGKLRFKDIPPLLSHADGLSAGELEQAAFNQYRDSLRDHRRVLLNRYELIDIARKVVGIGSVGTTCGVLLLASSDDDILILQLKEARRSVLEPYAGPSRYEHQGERVVAGQKIMQAATDYFLGWMTSPHKPHRQFFIRQLRDVKVGVNTALWTKSDFKAFSGGAGRILARAHARSGDAAFMQGYLGKSDAFDEAIADYAVAYAKQTLQDYETFENACRTGELVATPD